MERKLYRSDINKVIAGVCGGLGEYFNVDPVIVRLAFVVFVFAGGSGILGYAIAWIVIPRRPFESDMNTPNQGGHTTTSGSGGTNAAMFSSSSSMTRYLPGLILVIVGAVLLIRQTVFWFSWTEFLPVALIVVGAIVIYRSVQGRQNPSE